MKKVVTRSEIGHLWAHQTQPEARTSNESQSFGYHDGPENFYSYRACIGNRRVNQRGEVAFFLSTYNHSVTTSGHQIGLRRAAYGDFIFDAEMGGPQSWTAQDLWHYYQEASKASIEKAGRCRKTHTHILHLRDAVRYTELCNKALDWFDSDLIRLDVPQSIKDQIKELEENYEKELELERQRQEARQAAQQQQDADDFQYWLNGVTATFPRSYSNKIYLRLNPEDPNQVQTSRGVFFPVTHCGPLYTIFRACKSTGKEFKPTSRFMVGPYQLDVITPEYIQAGCHKILADEVERFAKVLGLT